MVAAATGALGCPSTARSSGLAGTSAASDTRTRGAYDRGTGGIGGGGEAGAFLYSV